MDGSSPQDILSFWFGPLDDEGTSDEAHQKRWFEKNEQFDEEVRARFAPTYAHLAASSHRPSWIKGPEGLLGAIIVIDQFSRNMFRDTPAMYAADRQARLLCYELLALGYDPQLPFSERMFSYMPLMHSERLVDQERCVELFQGLVDQFEGSRARTAEYSLKFAIAHRDIVARFGRFPHRNAILGRASSSEEEQFLKDPGSSF